MMSLAFDTHIPIHFCMMFYDEYEFVRYSAYTI